MVLLCLLIDVEESRVRSDDMAVYNERFIQIELTEPVSGPTGFSRETL
jgi:hypothetical protein